ncbi:MAG TPA: hypothetical protein DCM28_22900 [Phycisphaerales bacterium]|nr:hypothetical protein [Phycisphaerales bacterium]HCD31516.1 hypothetical protein [Phycisphaerales bacterium]|tara:strand:+ start:1072 stop:1347 length:276 start_codon:yes stop_codon:yes gene_type:complete
MVNWLIEALIWIYDWIIDRVMYVVDSILNGFITDNRFDIVAVLNTFKDSYAFVNQAIPFNECLTILLAAFVIKAGIRITRHVIGWIPGVDG